MTIEEFGDIINCDLVIRRYSNQNNRYMCQFEHSETKESEHSAILEGTYGNGYSISNAISDYVERIRGRFIVLNAYDKEKRKVYGVPETLTIN